jgi:hypothetical protein
LTKSRGGKKKERHNVPWKLRANALKTLGKSKAPLKATRLEALDASALLMRCLITESATAATRL